MKLTTITQVSVDGVMQGNGARDENRSDGFERGGWARPLFDNEAMTFVNQVYQRADAFLFGRRTYELFAGRFEGRQIVSEEHLRLMTSDQVPAIAKTPDSFFPGFWDGTGWGFGVGVDTEGGRAGRYGWSGGLGTNFFVDPDGTVGVLLTQVEMGERMQILLDEFQALPEAA